MKHTANTSTAIPVITDNPSAPRPRGFPQASEFLIRLKNVTSGSSEMTGSRFFYFIIIIFLFCYLNPREPQISLALKALQRWCHLTVVSFKDGDVRTGMLLLLLSNAHLYISFFVVLAGCVVLNSISLVTALLWHLPSFWTLSLFPDV